MQWLSRVYHRAGPLRLNSVEGVQLMQSAIFHCVCEVPAMAYDVHNVVYVSDFLLRMAYVERIMDVIN
jgi:hypothetical protein